VAVFDAEKSRMSKNSGRITSGGIIIGVANAGLDVNHGLKWVRLRRPHFSSAWFEEMTCRIVDSRCCCSAIRTPISIDALLSMLGDGFRYLYFVVQIPGIRRVVLHASYLMRSRSHLSLQQKKS
jgi:hypothetical protein